LEGDNEEAATQRLVNLICKNDGASYVLRGLLRTGRLSVSESRKATVVQMLRQARFERTDCISVRKITRDVWSDLKSDGIDTEAVVSRRP
jgi:hypothetical protein